MEKLLLIVDDNKEVIELIEEILSDLFDRVLFATTVNEAQLLLSEHTFSFVVLDINLEGQNGAEVIKFLVESPENSNKTAPFVIVSGIITPQFVHKHNQRFAGILMKPFEHKELRDIAESIIFNKPKPGSVNDIPYIECNLPFPVEQLEQKVAKVMEGVKKNAKLRDLFAEMKIDRSSDNYLLAHIGLLINISIGLCIQLEWITDKTLEKFVFAAYLHDMALAERVDLARIKSFKELKSKKEKLSESDYNLVLEHPLIAERTLEKFKEIPPDVGVIIRQHHEMALGEGFPAKINFQKISPLSTVFIIAADLTEYVLENPKWTVDNYLKDARIKFKGVHFNKVLTALDKIK